MRNGRLWYRGILLLIGVLLLFDAFAVKLGNDINAHYHPESYVPVSQMRLWLPVGIGVVFVAEAIFAVSLNRRTRNRQPV